MSELHRVILKRRALKAYELIVGSDVLDEIHEIARSLKGLRLLHLNSSAFGGGVAELLNTIVPLEVNVGLEAEWCVLGKNEPFFAITKKIHNALQGKAEGLTEAEAHLYREANEQYAAALTEAYDAIIVHDPQPAAMRSFLPASRARWIWRCHIDTSEPEPSVWALLEPHLRNYQVAVFTMREFAPAGWSGPFMVFIPPAIDPLAPKNRALPRYLCREVVSEFGVDIERPMMLQVSRFDPWKDPMGVIKAYRQVKKDCPEVQLVLIGSMAEDDPEGWEIYKALQAEDSNDPDLFILSNLSGVNAHEVNAFQRMADVVIQKSIREGFGLVISEAIWKGTPVVAGDTGGIRLQMKDGVGGFLVDSVDETAERTVYLLTHPEQAEAIARKGWQRIRDHFLTPRLLLDELKLLQSVVGSTKSARVADS